MASSDNKSISIRSQWTYRLSYHEQSTEGNTYQCYACKQGGCGPHYSRNSDGRNNDAHKLYYHPLCGELLRCDSSSATPVAKHPLYPTGNLVLKETKLRKEEKRCVVCDDEVQMLRYEWQHKMAQGSGNTYDAFHPLCASLAPQTKLPGELGIVLDLNERILGKCLLCNKKSTGWAYNSAGNCCFHVRCLKERTWNSLQKTDRSGKNKVTISVKIALQMALKIAAKVAVQLIAGSLFGFPSPGIGNLIVEFFEE